MWPVSDNAMTAPTSERIVALSQHKNVHYDHKMQRTPYMMVTDNAQNATPSQRIEQLSQPKSRVDRYGVLETEWGEYNPVSSLAMKGTFTERVEALANPKGYHKDFGGEKPIQWQVENSALNAIATIRLQQLARPRSRTMINDDFDPYKVSPSARRARVTQRLDELCVPIPRKCRAKKLVWFETLFLEKQTFKDKRNQKHLQFFRHKKYNICLFSYFAQNQFIWIVFCS